MKTTALFWVAAALLLWLSGCKEGEKVGNTPPETTIFVQEINLTGEDRLPSEVQLYWSGEDKDGIVEGFEISFDNQQWDFVTVTDSTFRFDIPPNTDTLDIELWVRAIDDDGQADPSPAYLRIPIKNRPPSAVFNQTLSPNDTNLIVLTLSYAITDPDGDQSVNSVELKLNDGDWQSISPNFDVVSLVPENPTQTGPQNARVLAGPTLADIGVSLNDYRVGGDNVIYIRAQDQGLLFSEVDTSETFHVLQQTSDVLYLDNWGSDNISPLPREVFIPTLSSAQMYGSLDVIDLTDTNYVAKAGNLTYGPLFEQYDKIFWVIQEDQLEIFGESEQVLNEHLNQGGKLFLLINPPDSIPPASPFFRITGADSVSSVFQNALLANQGQGRLIPDSSLGDVAYPTIPNNNLFSLNGLTPFYPTQTAEPIYTANITQGNGEEWQATKVFFIRQRVAANTNQIFGTMRFHAFENPTEIESFFLTVKQEFDW